MRHASMVLVLLLIAPASVLGWGPHGHRVKTNLHSVWDEGLIESEKLSFSELAAFIDRPTLEELRTWQSSAPADWVRESKAVRDRIYRIGDGTLGYQYAFDHMPLIKRRLLQAGVRLAGLLNSIFARPGPSIADR